MLVVDLFLLSSISHQVFHHLPVHQRFSAEEIHFQIMPVPGIGDQEIQRFLSHFKTHKGAPAMVLPFFREAVFAGQIAVMGNMKA